MKVIIKSGIEVGSAWYKQMWDAAFEVEQTVPEDITNKVVGGEKLNPEDCWTVQDEGKYQGSIILKEDAICK